eukprot:1909474-Pyramimonas_sp.AAC.1
MLSRTFTRTTVTAPALRHTAKHSHNRRITAKHSHNRRIGRTFSQPPQNSADSGNGGSYGMDNNTMNEVESMLGELLHDVDRLQKVTKRVESGSRGGIEGVQRGYRGGPEGIDRSSLDAREPQNPTKSEEHQRHHQ